MAAITMVRSLAINNLQIIDVTPHPDQLATQLAAGRDYEMRVCVKNLNADDKFWYDNVQIRVAPVDLSVQFFTNSLYTHTMLQFNSGLFSLRSTQARWFIVPFRWTGNQPVAASSVKFDTGIYAHELPIQSAWKKLSHPI